jgi:GAF domain-containing protein/HAMP domain-containing protein
MLMFSWQKRGLRFKLSLGIIITLVIILGISFIGASGYIRNQLWQRETNASDNLNAMSAALLEEAMMAGRKDDIQEAINMLGNSVGGQIDTIAVYDDQSVLTAFATGFPDGRVISRSSVEINLTDPGCWECHRFPSSERPTMVVINLEDEDVLRNVVPLYNQPRCQSCHGTGQAVLGDSIVDLKLDQYNSTLTTVTLGLGIGFALVIALVAYVLFFLVRRIVISPLDDLINITQAVVQGDLEQKVEPRSGDEVGKLGTAFNAMTTQLRGLVGSLEQRVDERTRDLELRTAYLEASADVSQRAATVLDPDVLIQEIVDLIRDRFNLYYVGLFLVGGKREWAILRAGTGEAGKAMVARGHRLKVGEGMIGWCITNAKARIALDVGVDAVRFENPDLPETRSECALPMRSRDQVLGALSIQSKEPEAFNQDTITVLQTMADQVAIALENAQLYMESQTALEAEKRAYSILSQEAWQELLRVRTHLGVLATSDLGLQPPTANWTPDMVEAGKTGEIVRSDGRTISIPVILREQILGVVRLQKNEGEPVWTDDEIEMMDSLVDQLEVALESARLFDDTQRSAARERLVTEITTKIRSTYDPQSMLKTAIVELRRALQANRVQVFVPPSENDRVMESTLDNKNVNRVEHD